MQNPLPGIQSFIFGGNTDTPTVQSLKKRREIAEALGQQAVGGTPRNMGEGIAAIGKALAYRYMDHKISGKEEEAHKSVSDILAGLGGGGYTPSYSAPQSGGFTGAGMAPQGQPVAPAMGGGNNYADAISGIESGGNYGATGPEVKGDRAYGKYQVMGANIPSWTQEALGQQMDPQSFLSNPQAQDAVFQHRFGGYVDKYGPAGAASMWFSGDPTPDGDSDGYTKDTDYVSKFMDALGGGGGMGGGMGGGGPDMGKVSQIAEIMNNPYADEGQKMVAQALLQREMSAGGGGLSPYQSAQLGLGAQDNDLAQQRFNWEQEQAKQPKPTDDMREYNFYAEQATKAGQQPQPFNDWMLEQRRAGANNNNITMPGQTPKYALDRQAQFAEQMKGYETEEKAARGAVSTLSAMETAMGDPGFYSGAGGQSVLAMKRAAKALGMDPEGVDSIEQFNALASKSVLDAIGGSLGAQVSNSDRDFIERQAGNLGNTPEGNKRIIGMQKKLAERQIQVAKMAREYEKTNGQLDAGFSDQIAQWAEQNPLFKGMEPVGGGGDMGDIPQAAIDAEIDADVWPLLSEEDREFWRKQK